MPKDDGYESPEPGGENGPVIVELALTSKERKKKEKKERKKMKKEALAKLAAQGGAEVGGGEGGEGKDVAEVVGDGKVVFRQPTKSAVDSKRKRAAAAAAGAPGAKKTTASAVASKKPRTDPATAGEGKGAEEGKGDKLKKPKKKQAGRQLLSFGDDDLM